MKRFLLSLLTVGFLILPSAVYAAKYTRIDTDLDGELADQQTKQYAQPSKILISRIETDAKTLSGSPVEWFQTLYYYTITRLGYADIPFTFIVDREGNVYDGRDGGVGVIPESLEASGDIMIGYLSNSVDIPLSTEVALKELITTLSYKYGIGKDKLEVVTIKSVKGGQENLTTKNVYEKESSEFSKNLLRISNLLTFYKTEHLEYKAEVRNVAYPTKVKSGEKFKVTFEVVNGNDFAWFTDRNYIYITAADGKDSLFAINKVWDSFSKPYAIADKTVQPGEVVKVEFEMQALLLPGKASQKFNITKIPVGKFADSTFEIAFEIEKGSAKLVQVVGTPGGVLNVRECPSGNCESISTVVEGQVLVMLDTSVGWYEIRYEEGKSGWVYGPYIKQL